jgi:hypothetical protein
MLFMEPLFAALQDRALPRAGYADDSKLSARSKSLEWNCATLALDLAAVIQWCTENRIPLDYNKTNLMCFTCSTKAGNPPVQLPPGLPEALLEAIKPSSALKWLGVRLDGSLTFKQHSVAMTSKAKRAALALRMLGGCKRGAPAKLLRQAVTACVLPILTFTSDCWWKPPNMPRRGIQSLAPRADVVLRHTLRAALPLYCTTPNQLLYHYAGLAPATQLLDDASRRATIRLSRLDVYHPLR